MIGRASIVSEVEVEEGVSEDEYLKLGRSV